MDIQEEEAKEEIRLQAKAERREAFAKEDDQAAENAVSEYYNKPQNEVAFDYLYITPGAPEGKDGFKEWTRDSILSNYDRKVQRKVSLCVDQLRVLEIMKADAEAKKDFGLINEFILPLARFIWSEKTAFENTSRNIDGFNAQTSRSQFNTIQQFRYNEELERQAKTPGLLGKLKMPKAGNARYGWDV